MNLLGDDFQKKIGIQPLLHGLSSQEIETLAAQSFEVNFSKGQIIFEQDDPGEAMFLVQSGQVRLNRIDPSGKELVLAILGPGNFFGEMAVLDGGGRSSNAVAQTNLTLSTINRANFRNLILREPEIALHIIETLSQRLRRTDELMQQLAFGSVKERLTKLLIDEKKDNANQIITLTLTHQELATKIGASRETVTRILNVLRKEGWLIQKKTVKNDRIL